MPSVLHTSDELAKKQKKGIRQVTRNALEIGVQSGVVSTLVPSAAAGVGQVYSGMLPVMTMKGMADEMTDGGAVKVGSEKKSVLQISGETKKKGKQNMGRERYPFQLGVCKNRHSFPRGTIVFVNRDGRYICPNCGEEVARP